MDQKTTTNHNETTIQQPQCTHNEITIYNNHNETTHLGCQHFEMPNVMQATYFGSLFDIYLAFRNVNVNVMQIYLFWGLCEMQM